ncbi:hypothetical protein E2605_18170 [Dysgonomonas capnocytophagoides]|uniref:Uncharacterized protein n=1 Tax=Dysgonomonas capnocytophagoides TaxID=45254 RepID=A0A4Y8KYQ0_9BACT|nr:hypothetical protein [Dysgonomonas capnocytophagoides]TFD92771.1 hypothetical protein E2605_18170 [Dysgonomonas capnocytophagoides]
MNDLIIAILLIINSITFAFIVFRIYWDIQDIKASQKITEERSRMIYVQHLLWLKSYFEQKEEYENASRVNKIIKDLTKE